MYSLLIIASIACIISYLRQSFFAESEADYAYPKNFLVKNKFILKYFCNPEKPITKHYTIMHFIMLFYCIFLLIMYAIYWIVGNNPILENPQFIKYNLISFAVFFTVFYIVVAIIRVKFHKL
ncbi:MAG: hypothetical protein ACLRFR_01930 [Clostridia bacterium]